MAARGVLLPGSLWILPLRKLLLVYTISKGIFKSAVCLINSTIPRSRRELLFLVSKLEK
jgi:hypothetical protein